MFNINELFEKQNQIKLLKYKTYDNILSRISFIIKERHKYGDDHIIYEIPVFVSTKEIILNNDNKEECTQFVYKKLVDNGFTVRCFIKRKQNRYILFISWKNINNQYSFNIKNNERNNKKLLNYYKRLNKSILDI